ncbi:MAG: hypothetical protein EA392_00930 [Cryomorphaceae bacterium]|nr:MAG: hypothetical protein EA392_00930 [Cryomorphaceae bacterium]
MRKDATREIRQHYVDLLSEIEVNDKAIPVYNLAKVSDPPPYILVFGGVNEQGTTKGPRHSEISINVEVHTAYRGDYGGEKFMDAIVNEIIEKRYEKAPRYGETENFQLVTCQYNAGESLRLQTSTEVHIIRQITFNHFVNQKI